jgi:hypothetical protein
MGQCGAMRLFVFGLGYTGARLAQACSAQGTGRAGLSFDDEAIVRAALAQVTHVVSTVPPAGDADPVLARHGDALDGKWLGYLSSTGVYGDTGGAWVDESAPLKGRRGGRIEADRAWLDRGARVFRLPGIYGPGRSPLDRVAAGQAHRVAVQGQVFSRVHVDDIVAGVIAGFDAPPGAYNLSDDRPASQNDVVEHAARLLGIAVPPFVALDTLSPAARGFYGENRRVANGKAKRVLGWTPAYPDFVVGLGALRAMSSPMNDSAPPATARPVQR